MRLKSNLVSVLAEPVLGMADPLLYCMPIFNNYVTADT